VLKGQSESQEVSDYKKLKDEVSAMEKQAEAQAQRIKVVRPCGTVRSRTLLCQELEDRPKSNNEDIKAVRTGTPQGELHRSSSQRIVVSHGIS
jgi:hypothetical protein